MMTLCHDIFIVHHPSETHQKPDVNLVRCPSPEFPPHLTRALRHCEDMIQRYSRALNNSSVSLSGAALPHCNFSNVGKAVEDCMRAVIGVLLNLTHDNGTPQSLL